MWGGGVLASAQSLRRRELLVAWVHKHFCHRLQSAVEMTEFTQFQKLGSCMETRSVAQELKQNVSWRGTNLVSIKCINSVIVTRKDTFLDNQKAQPQTRGDNQVGV